MSDQEQKLTYAAEYALRFTKEAGTMLAGVVPDSPNEHRMKATLGKLIETVDTLIRSGHFIEQPPGEGGHKI